MQDSTREGLFNSLLYSEITYYHLKLPLIVSVVPPTLSSNAQLPHQLTDNYFSGFSSLAMRH